MFEPDHRISANSTNSISALASTSLGRTANGEYHPCPGKGPAGYSRLGAATRHRLTISPYSTTTGSGTEGPRPGKPR